MAKVKPNKDVIIQAIVKEIEKGQDRGKVLAKNGVKWQLSSRTFDRYWKTANDRHRELQIKAKEAADKAYIKASEEVAKKAVMSKAERMERLSSIARGELMCKVNTEKGIVDSVIPVEVNEMIKAMAEINKMEGDYAPLKTELSGKVEILPITGMEIH